MLRRCSNKDVGYFVSVTGGVISALSAQLARRFNLGMPRSFVGLYLALLFVGSRSPNRRIWPPIYINSDGKFLPNCASETDLPNPGHLVYDDAVRPYLSLLLRLLSVCGIGQPVSRSRAQSNVSNPPLATKILHIHTPHGPVVSICDSFISRVPSKRVRHL